MLFTSFTVFALGIVLGSAAWLLRRRGGSLGLPAPVVNSSAPVLARGRAAWARALAAAIVLSAFGIQAGANASVGSEKPSQSLTRTEPTQAGPSGGQGHVAQQVGRDYAARQAKATNAQNFEGGSTTIVIGSSALVIILVVILIVVLL